jgi:hypothetical protein
MQKTQPKYCQNCGVEIEGFTVYTPQYVDNLNKRIKDLEELLESRSFGKEVNDLDAERLLTAFVKEHGYARTIMMVDFIYHTVKQDEKRDLKHLMFL